MSDYEIKTDRYFIRTLYFFISLAGIAVAIVLKRNLPKYSFFSGESKISGSLSWVLCNVILKWICGI